MFHLLNAKDLVAKISNIYEKSYSERAYGYNINPTYTEEIYYR